MKTIEEKRKEEERRIEISLSRSSVKIALLPPDQLPNIDAAKNMLAPSPEDAYIAKNMLDEFSPRKRQVFMAVVQDNLSEQETADLLGIDRSSVRIYLRRIEAEIFAHFTTIDEFFQALAWSSDYL